MFNILMLIDPAVRKLLEAGLDENEAKVYSVLLKQRFATAEQIAKESGMYRRSVYDILNVLLKKGFISYSKYNKVNRYHSAGTELLRDEIRRRGEALESAVQMLNAVEDKGMKKTIEVYEGKEGIKSLLRSAIEYMHPGGEIVGFGERGNLMNLIPGFMHGWHAKRVEKKIKIRRLFNRDPVSKKSVMKLMKRQLTKQRMMPKGTFTSALGVWIFGHRTIQWFVKEDPLAVVIDGEEIARGFREQFDYMWEQAGKSEEEIKPEKVSTFIKKTKKKVQASKVLMG